MSRWPPAISAGRAAAACAWAATRRAIRGLRLSMVRSPPPYVDKLLIEGQGRRPSHLGLRPLQDHAERGQVQAELQEAHRPREGRHVRCALRRPQGAWSTPSSARSRRAGCSPSTSTSCRRRSAKPAMCGCPAATSGEMNLTSMNGERRMRLTERYMDPPGQAMPDCLIAARHRQSHGARLPRDGQGRRRRQVQGLRLEDRGRRLHGRLPRPREGRRVRHLRPAARHGHQRRSRSRRPPSRTARSSARSASSPTANSIRRTARRRSWRRNGGGSQAPGKEEESKKFAFLINNGRANHVWQSAYLDQQNDFVMDRWPYPFIQMNPQDMTELGLEAGRSRRGLQRQWRRRRPWPTRRRPRSGNRPSCCLPIRRACKGNVVSAGVNELIIPNYKQTWGNIRKIADAPANLKGVTFKSEEYAV